MSGTGVPELDSLTIAIEEKTAQLFHLQAGLNKLHGEIDALMARLETLTESEAEIASEADAGEDLSAAFEAELADDFETVAPAYVAMAVPAQAETMDEDEAREELSVCESLITTLEDAVQTDAFEDTAEADADEDTAEAVLLDDAAQADVLEDAARAAMADQSEDLADDLAEAFEVDASDTAALTPDDGCSNDTGLVAVSLIDDENLEDAQPDSVPCEVTEETLPAPTHTAYVDTAPVASEKADVLHLFGKEIPVADAVAAAQNGAKHIGRKIVLVAAVAGLFVGVQTTKMDFMPLMNSPHLALLTSCGKAVLAGNVTCASVTWSELKLWS